MCIYILDFVCSMRNKLSKQTTAKNIPILKLQRCSGYICFFEGFASTCMEMPQWKWLKSLHCWYFAGWSPIKSIKETFFYLKRKKNKSLHSVAGFFSRTKSVFWLMYTNKQEYWNELSVSPKIDFKIGKRETKAVVHFQCIL